MKTTHLKMVLYRSLAFVILLTIGSVQDYKKAEAAWVTRYGALVDHIEAVELKTSMEYLNVYADYEIVSIQEDFQENQFVYTISSPITLNSTGTLYIEPVKCTIGTSLEFSLYKDAECTEKVKNDVYWTITTERNDFTETKAFEINEPGTYHVGIKVNRYFNNTKNVISDNKVTFRPYFVSNEEKEMRSGSWTVIDRMDEAEQYLKFEIKTDGYACFKTMVDLDVILCDVNRKELQNISLKANQEFEMSFKRYQILYSCPIQIRTDTSLKRL